MGTTIDVRKEVLAIIANTLGRDDVNESGSMMHDYGADSLDIEMVNMEVEKHFEIKVKVENANDLKNVGDYINLIEKIITSAKEQPEEDLALKVISREVKPEDAKVFRSNRLVHIGDTNFEGNAYFNNINGYFGEARDLLALAMFSNLEDKLGKDFILITRKTTGEYFHDLYFGDQIVIEITCSKLDKKSVELFFEVKRNDIICAVGTHLILCADMQHKLIDFPISVLEKIAEYRKI